MIKFAKKKKVALFLICQKKINNCDNIPKPLCDFRKIYNKRTFGWSSFCVKKKTSLIIIDDFLLLMLKALKLKVFVVF